MNDSEPQAVSDPVMDPRPPTDSAQDPSTNEAPGEQVVQPPAKPLAEPLAKRHPVIISLILFVCGQVFVWGGSRGLPPGLTTGGGMSELEERLLMLCGFVFSCALPGTALPFLHLPQMPRTLWLRRSLLSSGFGVGLTLFVWTAVYIAFQPTSGTRLAWLDPIFFVNMPIFLAIAASVIWLEATRLKEKLDARLPVLLFVLGSGTWMIWVLPGAVDALLPAVQAGN